LIGTGRAADRDRALGLGVDEFMDLETDPLEAVGEVDVVLDVIGGDILRRSTSLVRAGGTLVTIAEPPTIQPENGRAILFVVEADRSQLAELARRLRDRTGTRLSGARQHSPDQCSAHRISAQRSRATTLPVSPAGQE
jgi:NADPH:quinone reductase-like Zn-dependent oxidoreductase